MLAAAEGPSSSLYTSVPVHQIMSRSSTAVYLMLDSYKFCHLHEQKDSYEHPCAARLGSMLLDQHWNQQHAAESTDNNILLC